MGKRMWLLLLVVAFFSLSFSGCYYFSARNEIKSAEKLVADLKAQGGEKLVPYEYCSAQKFLENARLERDENDFKVARWNAIRSKSASQAGLAEIQRRK